MARSVFRTLMALLLVGLATPAFGSGREEGQIVAPSKAVAEAWAREERSAPVSKAVTALQVSYAGLQALDMWTTVAARSNGAREVNPLMSGSYAQGAALKAAMGAGTMLATRALAKKNRKAAVVTMLVLNGVTAVVAANNARNARQ